MLNFTKPVRLPMWFTEKSLYDLHVKRALLWISVPSAISTGTLGYGLRNQGILVALPVEANDVPERQECDGDPPAFPSEGIGSSFHGGKVAGVRNLPFTLFNTKVKNDLSCTSTSPPPPTPPILQMASLRTAVV
jgi:hypothetical protein